MERLGTKALLGMLGDWSAGDGASLHRRLVDAFGQAIETGVLEPGTVLPAERTLARTLCVSRSTVTATLNELKSAGLLTARQGSGTVVAGDPERTRTEPPAGATVLPGLLGEWGGIDLAASTPADARALPDVEVDLDALLQTGARHGYTPAGLPELREAVARRFSLDGLATDPDEVLITNGAQHALALAFAQLAQPGDEVIVDEPTYPGVVDLLAARDLRPLALPRSAGPIDVDQLARLANDSGCSLAYLQTSVHNPTGLVSDEAGLRRLATAADRLGLMVIEDIVLADLRFDGSRPSPLAARVTRAETVVVGSVSKLGWGGLRIGWLRAPRAMVARIVRSRLADDLGSSIPSQVISAAVLGNFDVIAESRQRTLARRAELARELLAQSCPEWELHRPEGGLSLWISLGDRLAEPLAQQAAREGVVIATGQAATVGFDGGAGHIRLCFDRPEPQLREGLQRLASAWNRLGRRQPADRHG